AAVLLSLVLFSGDSQSFGMSSGGVLLLALVRGGAWRADLVRAGTVVGAGALLGAAQLVPAVHLLREALGEGQGAQTALQFSLHPIRLLELLLGPLFVGSEGTVGALGVAKHILRSRSGGL